MAWLLYARLVFLAALAGVTALCVWVELTSEGSPENEHVAPPR
jgi:hypothetical protein